MSTTMGTGRANAPERRKPTRPYSRRYFNEIAEAFLTTAREIVPHFETKEQPARAKGKLAFGTGALLGRILAQDLTVDMSNFGSHASQGKVLFDASSTCRTHGAALFGIEE